MVLQMIDISVTNAFLLYKKIGGTSRQIWFRKNVIRSLRGSQNRPKTASAPVAFKQNKASDLTRLIGQHICVLSQQMHPKQDLAKSVVCRKNGRRRETRYVCETCPSQPALCVAECFKRFHRPTEHEL